MIKSINDKILIVEDSISIDELYRKLSFVSKDKVFPGVAIILNDKKPQIINKIKNTTMIPKVYYLTMIAYLAKVKYVINCKNLFTYSQNTPRCDSLWWRA